jgi:hypothetical protein
MRHALLFASFAFVSACAADVGTVEVSVTTDAAAVPESAGDNALALSLGDGVHVTVTAVDVAIADDAVEDEAASDSGWVTVFEGAQPLDLLAADQVKAFLGASLAPAGRITQVRVVLAPDPTISIDGTVSSLRCPSCTPTGIKVVPHGTLTVPDGGTLDLTLAIDVRSSLHRDGTDYWLQPVVRL